MRSFSNTIQEVEKNLQSDTSYGLTFKQVEKRIDEYGLNQLPIKKGKSMVSKFFAQFNDFMILTLIAAATISFVISYANGETDFIDPIIILAIVIINAVLGLLQENKAEKSIEALKKMTNPESKVVRDGKVQVVSTDQLVIGDLIILETGDFVPADARLVKSSNLKIEESALTGESVPVDKNHELIIRPDATIGDRKNMVYSGSSVTYGHGKALVTATGSFTEVGKIAHMIQKNDAPDTPLQKKLETTGKMLGILALGICLFIFGLGVFQGTPAFTMFMTSVSLAVAAIPEGLPAIVTIMLAIGVQRMAKHNSIIRKLPAVETLGSATVICSDKTGTLTQNKMKVVEVWDSNGALHNGIMKKDIIKYATMCNDSIQEDDKVLGDPTETAIVLSALRLDISKNILEKEMPRIDEIPFDSTRKLMSTLHKTRNGKYLLITKGAPDVLVEKCNYYHDGISLSEVNTYKRKDILNNNVEMASKALRVLAVAYKEYDAKPKLLTTDKDEKNLTFMGLIGLIDPPREETKEAVSQCLKAGIKTVMVTGDHVVTAKAIATKIGILGPNDKSITGKELNEISQEELNKTIKDYSVFARVSPEHKVRIVKSFQSRGEIVAMTGDGVNDAPALKAADIGCAMGISGTDVAKGAADMVLTDDNFATIVEAVKEGRGIYSNIRKAVHFLLSSNIGEIITILVAMILGWKSPLLAIHLLWVNLVTDSLPAIALGVEKPDKDIMLKKPFDNHSSLFSGGLGQKIATEGIMIGMLALLAFGIGSVYFDTDGTSIISHTMAFATLSISQLFHAFNMKSEKSLFDINIFDNMYLVGAFIIGIIMQIGVISIEPLATIFKVTSLNLQQWGIVFLLSFAPIILVELEKKLSNIEKEVKIKNSNVKASLLNDN